MNLVNFLNDNVTELPKTRPDECANFSAFLRSTFDMFLEHFSKLEGNDPITSKIKANRQTVEQLCSHLLKAIKQSEKGAPHLAFAKIEQATKSIEPFLHCLATPTLKHDQIGVLYRVRSGPLEANRKALFHLPFELRHKVGTQRYSVPCLPCLYLSGSLYTAWKEISATLKEELCLASNSFQEIHFSRFKLLPNKSKRLLTLGYRPAYFAACLEKCPRTTCEEPLASLIAAQVICWPLFAACSIKKKHQNAKFAAEYVIPQLLLQWVTAHTKYCGITYLSTHTIEQYPNNPHLARNFVFPAQKNSPSGYCAELCSSFELSEPILLPMANLDVESSASSILYGSTADYQNTRFGQFELKCASVPLAPILPNGQACRS